MNQAAGNVQKKASDWTDNEEMERESRERQLKGGLQEGVGKTERKVDDTLDA